MIKLEFKNQDAEGSASHITMMVDNMKTVAHIAAWYGPYHNGDDYKLYVNGVEQKLTRDGELED